MKEIIDDLNKKYNEYRTQVKYLQNVIDRMAKLEYTNKRAAIDDIRKLRDTAEEKSPDFSDSLNLMCWIGGKAPLVFSSMQFATPHAQSFPKKS